MKELIAGAFAILLAVLGIEKYKRARAEKKVEKAEEKGKQAKTKALEAEIKQKQENQKNDKETESSISKRNFFSSDKRM